LFVRIAWTVKGAKSRRGKRDEYLRIATGVKKDDGSLGTIPDPNGKAT
jgi:hypothetical protein